MRDKFESLKNRKYTWLFVFIMMLNVVLTFSLILTSFSQAQQPDFSQQKPVKVEIAQQRDCPLKLSVENVDDSASTHQAINYNVQNVSVKPIRAYTLVGNGEKNGRVVSNSFTTNLLQISEYSSDNFAIERESLQDDSTIVLSIDYVEFADGSSWGDNSQKTSERLNAERQGRQAALNQLKDLIVAQRSAAKNEISNLLQKNITEIDVAIPENNRSEEWKRSYQRGYRAVVSVLQRERTQDATILLKKIDEMKQIAN